MPRYTPLESGQVVFLSLIKRVNIFGFSRSLLLRTQIASTGQGSRRRKESSREAEAASHALRKMEIQCKSLIIS